MQISDKAAFCPHCGLPRKNTTRAISRKRKKLPNGFGRITKIASNKRKPYRAMITVGKDEYGKPIGKLLSPTAYFETYNAAYEALLAYHKNPYDISKDLTVKEVYDQWSKEYYKTVSRSSRAHTESSWKYCEAVHNEKMRNIRIHHIKYCIEEGCTTRKDGSIKRPSKDMKERIKLMWNKLFDYAIEYDLVDRNYAREYRRKNEKIVRTPHQIYTEEEMRALWADKDDYITSLILIQCYSGLRPTELLTLKAKNIDIDKNIMIGGIKTKAGKERIIPIHPLIKPLIEKHLKMGYETLVEPMHYNELRRRFNENMAEGNHKLHDGRKHFVTLAKKYDVDEFAIKRIVGHTIHDITESTYTERSDAWLYSEICKIKQY